MKRGICLCLCWLGLTACASDDPVRIHRADVKVGDTRISVSDGGSGGHPAASAHPGRPRRATADSIVRITGR